MSTATPAPTGTSKPSQLMTGADILVQSLVRHGVDTIFAYPGGASMPLHQALTRVSDELRTILPRHEQGGAFAAQGLSRSTGKVGVVMATSGPGATNLVTAIADAKLDSVPMVCITGQVPTTVIGSDAFQETPMVEVCRGITKHHYLLTDVNDIARVMKEAFLIAATGRPGPVLVDVPKDVQLASCVPDFDCELNLPGYTVEKPLAKPEALRQAVAAIKRAKKPVVYAGGGIILSDASEELRAFVKKTGIPITTTVMGLGAYPGTDELSLDMLGMHGSVYANWAVDQADLLIALGVRFDDRVTGKVDEFCKHGKIIHVDIDAAEINKNKAAHIPVQSDVKHALAELNKIVEAPEDISDWVATCQTWKAENPFTWDKSFPGITQQSAIDQLWRQTADADPVVTVGVGQHQMWAAQFYKFNSPRTWLSSSGLGTMGFGLPAAMGVQAAYPDRLVIDIDGDGSFQMNIQELSTLVCEKLPVKVFLLNNQHLGMVVQWEDRFMEGNRAHTYLGPIDKPEWHGEGDGVGELDRANRYADFVAIAKGYGCGGAYVEKPEDLEGAIDEMVNYRGPYVLDVAVPYQEHVLPMIPGGKTVRDMITK
ncbi:MAG: biosynthetic-type acetolactate synthase large subunit [Planctomycetota bacterium]